MLRREVDKQSAATLCHLYQCSVTYDYLVYRCSSYVNTTSQIPSFQIQRSISEQARHPAPVTLGMLQGCSVQAKAESLKSPLETQKLQLTQ